LLPGAAAAAAVAVAHEGAADEAALASEPDAPGLVPDVLEWEPAVPGSRVVLLGDAP
jgi:hypothetical protein